jgi:hypothetical protein
VNDGSETEQFDYRYMYLNKKKIYLCIGFKRAVKNMKIKERNKKGKNLT